MCYLKNLGILPIFGFITMSLQVMSMTKNNAKVVYYFYRHKFNMVDITTLAHSTHDLPFIQAIFSTLLNLINQVTGNKRFVY